MENLNNMIDIQAMWAQFDYHVKEAGVMFDPGDR